MEEANSSCNSTPNPCYSDYSNSCNQSQIICSSKSRFCAYNSLRIHEYCSKCRTHASADLADTQCHPQMKYSKLDIMKIESPHSSVSTSSVLLPESKYNLYLSHQMKSINFGNCSIGGTNILEGKHNENVIKFDITTDVGFYCVISMQDGIVLNTSQNITDNLLFPMGMWLGRSFIDFVHPKDRSTFASLTRFENAVPLSEAKCYSHRDFKSTLYVMLRRYRGLRSVGYGVTTKEVNYEPYQLVLSFRDASGEQQSDKKSLNGSSMLLIICASPVKSIYKWPNEGPFLQSPKFLTRHTATGLITHVDGSAVSAFGYLPQDMIGRSIMQFYHPDDLPFLKSVYETVILKAKTGGMSFCSKEYRFLVQNGCFITMYTEWTSFVNPWTRELQFVNGYHRILRGPSNPDIFSLNKETPIKMFDDESQSAKDIIDDILNSLSKPIARPVGKVKKSGASQFQSLASFMDTLDSGNKSFDTETNLQKAGPDHDVFVLDEITAYHDSLSKSIDKED